MKTFKRMTVLAVMMTATLASAELKNLATGPKFEVPFNFQIGDLVLPAGEYEVRVDGKVLRFLGQDGLNSVALTHYVGTSRPAENSTLEFVNESGTYQLYRVWHAGENQGEELSLRNAGAKVAKTDTTRIAVGK
jgi:hypothetical protein